MRNSASSSRAWWRKGLGTTAARMVVRYAFDVLGIAEIRAEVLASNIASKRLLESAGFRFEPTIPEFEQTDERPIEDCLYVVHSSNAALLGSGI